MRKMKDTVISDTIVDDMLLRLTACFSLLIACTSDHASSLKLAHFGLVSFGESSLKNEMNTGIAQGDTDSIS